MMQPDSGNPVRLLGLLAALALGFGCLLVLRPFLSALLWAAILVYSTWPAFRMLRERLRLSPGLAALLMVLAEFLLIGVPLVFATPTKREEIDGLRASVEAFLTQGMPGLGDWLGRLPLIGPSLQDHLAGVDFGFSGLADLISPYAAHPGAGCARGAAGGAVGPGGGADRHPPGLLPLPRRPGDRPAGRGGAGPAGRRPDPAYRGADRRRHPRRGLWPARHRVGAGADDLVRAVDFRRAAAGAAGGHRRLHLDHAGRARRWSGSRRRSGCSPRAQTGWAIFLGLYGAFGISSADNVIRPWLIARGADLPLLLTLLGALGGVFAFGFLGLFLGPVLLAVGFTLLKDWADEAAPRQKVRAETFSATTARAYRSSARPGITGPGRRQGDAGRRQGWSCGPPRHWHFW